MLFVLMWTVLRSPTRFGGVYLTRHKRDAPPPGRWTRSRSMDDEALFGRGTASGKLAARSGAEDDARERAISSGFEIFGRTADVRRVRTDARRTVPPARRGAWLGTIFRRWGRL